MASTHSLNDQLLIKAENNNFGFIAIDDVSVTPGPCQGINIALISIANDWSMFDDV